jgi:5-methylcytosine-specific restriction endonuclease McrA
MLCPDGFRVCRTCWESKPLTAEFFYDNGTGKGKLRQHCKVCSSEVSKRRGNTPEGKEKRRQLFRNYYYANRAAMIKRALDYHAANPEKKRERDKKYYRKWRKDPVRVEKERARIRAKENKRRAQKLASGGSFDPEDLEQMYENQQGLCAYCETVLFGDYHADHMIPLSRGGSNDVINIAITCPPCNLRKNDRTAEEYMALLMS